MPLAGCLLAGVPMKRSSLNTCLLLTALCAVPVLAQERGRTDGPENSEQGKGGYSRQNGGRFSLAFNWGAAFESGDSSPPLYAGGTASYWVDDLIIGDATVLYLADTKKTEFMIGPRFRTPTYPVGFSAGLKAGAATHSGDSVRFLLSPQVGVDFALADHLLLGLVGAADIALGQGTAFRAGMDIGWRF